MKEYIVKNRSLASKLGLFGGAAVAATAGLASLGLIGVTAAGAATATTTVSDIFGGPLPIINTPTEFTMPDTVTLPTTVTTGGTIALSQSLAFVMPANLASAASAFSATGFTVNTVADTIDGTDTTQATVTVGGTNTPFTDTIAQSQVGLVMAIAPADFTASAPGTATFTQDTVVVNATVVAPAGTALAGDNFNFPMTPGQNTNATNMGSGYTGAIVPATVLGTVPVTAPISPQTITVTSTAPSGATAGGATYTPTATASSGLPVAISVDAASSGCSLSGGVVSFTAAGTCELDFNQAGNASFSAAPQVQQSFAVAAAAKQNQTITAASAPGSGSSGGSFTPSATASSGLAVTITLDASSTGCSLSGGVVSFTGAGTCKIDYNQVGNSSYNAAPQVQQSINIAVTPIGPIGGVALAGVAGLGLVVVQRRRSRRAARAQA